MQMPWFRLYSEARNDAKLRSLTDAQHRVWFNLLCLASEQPTRGVIEYETTRLLSLEVSSGDETLLEETCVCLQELRIIDRDVTQRVTGGNASGRYIAFRSFDKRQKCNGKSVTSSSAERVRKYRARRKMEQDGNACNAVTPKSERYITRSSPEEKREEKRREDTPLTPQRGTGGDVDDASLSDQTPKASPPSCLPSRPALAVVADDEEPFHAPIEAKVPAVSGPGRDSVQAKDLETWAQKLCTDRFGESYAYWARQKCDYVPPIWLKRLLETEVEGRSGQRRRPINYLVTILQGWIEAGECPLLTKRTNDARGYGQHPTSRPAPPIEFPTPPPEFLARYAKG